MCNVQLPMTVRLFESKTFVSINLNAIITIQNESDLKIFKEM